MVAGLSQALAPTPVQQTDGVRPAAVQAPQTKGGVAKLQKAAEDFEAILINSLWGSMKNGSLGSEDDLAPSSGGSLEQLGMQMVSDALAKAGGLGISKTIVRALQLKV
jgi:Rod binding domain-containing protein